MNGTIDFDFVYNLNDHLGNVRISFTKDATGNADIVQQDHYYPFGMRMANLSENDGNDISYLYNYKEFENDHNLSWYYYGARYYDPQICRWLQVDPAALILETQIEGTRKMIKDQVPNKFIYDLNDNTEDQ